MPAQLKSPGTVVNDTVLGNCAWNELDNAKASDDARAYAYNPYGAGAMTNYLKATNFGFSIPAGMQIDGITVEVEKQSSHLDANYYCYDFHMKIVKANGVLGATDKGNGISWPTTDAYSSYGGAADVWGESWTPEDINDPDFGAAISAVIMSNGGTNVYARIDHIQITVTYSVPVPTAPTGLTRTNYDGTDSGVFSWTFNDPYPGATQSAYQLLILDVADGGATEYDSGKVTSTSSQLTLPALTLGNNKQWQWKVKVWDNLDQAGPYSDLATFYTSAKPVTTITTPATNGATVGTPYLNAIWTYSDTEAGAQSAYQAELLDSLGAVLETTGKVATATLVKTFAYTLVNGGSYGVRVTVWDAKDVPSAAVTRTFVVSFTAPTKPSVVATTDGIRGSITLTVTNPLPDASKAVLHYNDVYRKKASESTCEQIATGIDNNGTFTDYTPASGQQYDYVIRAIGVTGGYSDSDACRTSVSFKHSQLAQASDYSNLVVLPYNPSRKEARRYERVLMEFAGRTSPVAEFGEHDGWALGLGFNILTDADLQALRDIVDLNETLLYRDQRGRREFVSIDTLDIDDQFRPKYYKVGITPDRVSYIEPVFDGDYDASEILFWWFGKTLYDSRWNLPLTFTRASGANEHFAGTAIASGIPNYGPGTEGVLVEEAATPKLANPFFATDGDADGLADSWSKLNAFAEATYSLSTSSYAWGNGKAQKVAINNAAYNDAMLGIRQDFAVSAGDKISIRFACKTNKTVVKARLYDVTGSAVLATMSFTVTPDTKADISYSFAAVPAGCSNARLYFYVTGTAGAWSTSDYVEFYCAHAEAKAYITTPCTAARAAGTLSAANINFPASGPAWCYAVVRPTWASDNPPGTRDKWLSLCFGDVNNLIGVRCVTTAGNPLLFRCTKNGVAKNIDLPTSLSWQAYETIRLLYGQRSTGKFCAVKIADRAIVIVNDTDTSPFVTAPTTHYFGHYQDGNGQINGFVGPDDEATGNITDDQIYAMFEQIVNLASNGDFTKWTRDAHATSSADGQILTLVATDNYQFSTWECPLWPNTSYIVSQECSGRINASHTPSTIGKWLDAAGNSISNAWDEGAAGANGVVTRTLTSPSNAVALRLYASNIGTGTYTFKPFTVTPRKTISAGQNLLVNGGFDKGTNPTGALGLTLHAEANTTAVLGKLQLVATAADHNSYETVYGIVGGASYTHGVTIVGANGVSYVSWYNSSNAFISSSGNINPGTPSQTITAPANAAIAHVNYKSSSAGTFTFDDAILSRNA